MRGTLLTDFELMILLAILRVGDEAYGVPIGQEIESTAGRRVVRAAIYAALNRLEARGLVRAAMGDPTPERGGRAKRYYALTAKGLRATLDTQQALTALWRSLPQLKGGRA